MQGQIVKRPQKKKNRGFIKTVEVGGNVLLTQKHSRIDFFIFRLESLILLAAILLGVIQSFLHVEIVWLLIAILSVLYGTWVTMRARSYKSAKVVITEDVVFDIQLSWSSFSEIAAGAYQIDKISAYEPKPTSSLALIRYRILNIYDVEIEVGGKIAVIKDIPNGDVIVEKLREIQERREVTPAKMTHSVQEGMQDSNGILEEIKEQLAAIHQSLLIREDPIQRLLDLSISMYQQRSLTEVQLSQVLEVLKQHSRSFDISLLFSQLETLRKEGKISQSSYNVLRSVLFFIW